MYGSHDVRHVDFRGLTASQRTPRVWGVTCDTSDNGSAEDTFFFFVCLLVSSR